MNEAQCKEIAFNERKLQLAKVEAALAGHLSPDEIRDDLIHAVDGHVNALAANQKFRRADAKRQALHSNKPPLQPSRRQQVFAVAPLTREECCKVNADLVTEMADADAFVVADPADPPKVVWFLAGLLGASMITKEHLLSKGAAGAAVAFHQAISIKRFVHFSFAFMNEHLDLCSHIHQVLCRTDCKWQLQALSELVTDCGAARSENKRLYMLFLTESELYSGLGSPQIPNRLTFSSGLTHDFVCKLSHGRCRTGVCANY